MHQVTPSACDMASNQGNEMQKGETDGSRERPLSMARLFVVFQPGAQSIACRTG
jgi:hypothetical protein